MQGKIGHWSNFSKKYLLIHLQTENIHKFGRLINKQPIV